MSIGTTFIIYDQTTSGKIKIREEYGGYSATGTGGYITGDGGYFTIWQETKQGEEAGLPSDIIVYTSFIMSGSKVGNGDLNYVNSLSVITKVISNSNEYDDEDLESIEGTWWMAEGNFELTGPPKLKVNNTFNDAFQKLINNILIDMFKN